METVKAIVEQSGDSYFISIQSEPQAIRIPMSENKPKEVKSAFNKLITRVKGGVFRIQLEKTGEDLFSQVAKEYLTQLNREIEEVHTEMKQYGLVTK